MTWDGLCGPFRRAGGLAGRASSAVGGPGTASGPYRPGCRCPRVDRGLGALRDAGAGLDCLEVPVGVALCARLAR
jgi:hypothetical protein